ncbi:MAG: hypothetical protein DRO05_05735 [Thermoproteota archaeon]|nr:MAG: hypothetical protein DRO05_05735 [Candidatus Korarchaeota archaeon]
MSQLPRLTSLILAFTLLPLAGGTGQGMADVTAVEWYPRGKCWLIGTSGPQGLLIAYNGKSAEIIVKDFCIRSIACNRTHCLIGTANGSLLAYNGQEILDLTEEACFSKDVGSVEAISWSPSLRKWLIGTSAYWKSGKFFGPGKLILYDGSNFSDLTHLCNLSSFEFIEWGADRWLIFGNSTFLEFDGQDFLNVTEKVYGNLLVNHTVTAYVNEEKVELEYSFQKWICSMDWSEEKRCWLTLGYADVPLPGPTSIPALLMYDGITSRYIVTFPEEPVMRTSIEETLGGFIRWNGEYWLICLNTYRQNWDGQNWEASENQGEAS